jgi:hypothetical protein
MTRKLRRVFVVAACVVATSLCAGRARAETITAEKLLHAMQQKFLSMKIRSMTYDEDRLVVTKIATGADAGMMMMNSNNAAHYRMRYFYKAPNRHAYKMISKKIQGFYPGNPNQDNNIAMDESWERKVIASYRPVMSKDITYRGRAVYVFNLVPRAGTKETYPMTFYVDQQSLLILKFVFLVTNPDKKKSSTTGEMYYAPVKGRMMPSAARWTSSLTGIPYVVHYRIKFLNYRFDIPIPDSTFNLEY